MGLFRWTDYDLMTTCMIISKLKSPDVEDFLCVCFCTGFGIYSNMYQYTGPVPADRESPMTRSETSPSRAQHPSPTQKPNTCCFCWCCCCSCSWYDPLTCLCLHMVQSTHHRCSSYIPRPFLHRDYIHLHIECCGEDVKLQETGKLDSLNKNPIAYFHWLSDYCRKQAL